MTRDERKQFLQSTGALPPDDALMPFPGDTSAPGPGDEIMAPGSAEPTKPAEPQTPSFGQGLVNAGRAYAKAYGVDVPEAPAPVNPEDPREKLKKLMTPEFMQQLRTKAGMGTGTPQ